MEKTLGKRISTHRKAMGLTQDQLAEKLGVTAQAVSKWENDQSCPDISILPQLAEIFGTSIDSLLGRATDAPVHEATVVDKPNNPDDDSIRFSKGGWEFKYDNSRRTGIGFAIFVLLVGGLWLTANLLTLNVTFWDIAWPSAFLVFGLFGLYPKFSFIRLGSALLGLYYLLNNFNLLPFDLNGKNLLLPACLLIFGLSLLLDALRKPKKPKFSFTYNGKDKVSTNDYNAAEDHFHFSASFSEQDQLIRIPTLRYGSISTSFGEYTLDLSGVETIDPDCKLEVCNSFGELTLLIPKRYALICENSTSFASIDIDGMGDGSGGVITLEASCSFGSIDVQFI
jgi:transcriptional regulator with XRE-family HTH domain